MNLAEESDSLLGEVYQQLSDLIEKFNPIQISEADSSKYLDTVNLSVASEENSGNIKKTIIAILSDQLHTLDWLHTFSMEIKQKIATLSNETYNASLKLQHPEKE